MQASGPFVASLFSYVLVMKQPRMDDILLNTRDQKVKEGEAGDVLQGIENTKKEKSKKRTEGRKEREGHGGGKSKEKGEEGR